MEQLSESEWREIFEEQEKDSKRNVDMMRKYKIPKATYIRYKKKYAAKKNDFLELKREEEQPTPKQKHNKTKLTFPNGLIIEVSW